MIVFRYLFGWTMPPKFGLVNWLRQTFKPPGFNEIFVCQDVFVELQHIPDILEFIDDKFGIHPIWLCPVRHVLPSKLKHHHTIPNVYVEGIEVDIGVYG